jgi:hypothetical protein
MKYFVIFHSRNDRLAEAKATAGGLNRNRGDAATHYFKVYRLVDPRLPAEPAFGAPWSILGSA